MIQNEALAAFVKISDRRLKEFYEQEPDAIKMERLSLHDSKVQERMMRIGIEARHFGVSSEDDLCAIAIATLKNDYVKHYARQL